MKKTIITLSILCVIIIGLFQYDRIDSTYFPPQSIELYEPHYLEMSPPAPLEEEILYPDSAVAEENIVVPEEPMVRDSEPYQPSDRALEAKFWMDTIGSFLTALSPLLVPFIMYRKKGKDNEPE